MLRVGQTVVYKLRPTSSYAYKGTLIALGKDMAHVRTETDVVVMLPISILR